mgnify:CR=1 FL=1
MLTLILTIVLRKQKLLSLGSQLDSIEQKEIFRLGMKEMLVNLADMNLIPLNLK